LAALIFYFQHSGRLSIQKQSGISVCALHAASFAQLRLTWAGHQQTERYMFDRIINCRSIALVATIAATTSISLSSANAGTCPADQAKANARQPVTHAAKGVTDTTLAAIDLERELANIKERQLRFRKMTITPGGIVPWHSHGDRPAIIYIAEGEVIEYASTCAVPIVHKAGEVRPETNPTEHWWENKTKKNVVLFIGDVLHDKTDKNM